MSAKQLEFHERVPETDYVRVGIGSITRGPSRSLVQEGKRLVQKCLRDLGDFEAHPPKLFILWVTSAYSPFDQLLKGVHQELKRQDLTDVPLIGSSVAVCFFDYEPHENGALLICLGSAHLAVKPSLASGASEYPARAVPEFLDGLELKRRTKLPVNPRENRFLIAFVPGCGDVLKRGHGDRSKRGPSRRPQADPLDHRAAQIVEGICKETDGNLHLFGGVSSPRLKKRGRGHQFYGQGVFTDSIVGALVESSLEFGIGLNHGLVPTGQKYHVTVLKGRRRRIIKFREGSPMKVMAEVGSVCVFGAKDKLGQTIIIKGSLHGDELRLFRDLPIVSPRPKEGIEIEVFRPDLTRTLQSIEEHEELIRHRFRLSPWPVAILTIGCVSRYNHKDAIGFDLEATLRERQKRFPGCKHVGCYMDGEIGVDPFGRSNLSNWSIADLVLGGGFTVKAGLFGGLDALKVSTQPAATASSLEVAMDHCLDCVKRANYKGAMISLVFEDDDANWIVGSRAFPDKWAEVRKLTARKFSGDDILAIVARRKKPKLVLDAQKNKSCEKEAARLADVISFYTIPLLNEKKKTIGLLQVDLGDRRRLGVLLEDEKAVLDSIGEMTAAAVNRAILHEELRLIRLFDDLLPHCSGKSSLDEAVSEFAKGAADRLGADVHIRLHDKKTGTLRLISGTGQYYEAINTPKGRINISASDPKSPAAKAFNEKAGNVVNDVEDDQRLEKKREGQSKDVRASLNLVKAYANFPLMQPKRRPIGVVCLGSSKPWFFTQSKLRTLDDISQRLAILLSHVRQKEARTKALGELRFLTEISPRLHHGLNVLSVLDSLTKRLQKAVQSDPGEQVVASCYLYDEIQDCMVLRAQAGWHDREWVNAAWYNLPVPGKPRTKGVGLIGRLAASRSPLFIHDVKAYKRRHGIFDNSKGVSGRYEVQTFGRILTKDEACELLAIPIHFNDPKPLAIIAVHGKIQRGLAEGRLDRFAGRPLEEAAKILSPLFYALLKHDRDGWEAKELERRSKVDSDLRKKEGSDVGKICQAFCDSIRLHYRFRRAAIYRKNSSGDIEMIASTEGRAGSNQKIRRTPPTDRGRSFLRLCAGEGTVEDRTPWTEDPDNPKKVKAERLVEGFYTRVKPGMAAGKSEYLVEFRWQGRRKASVSGPLPHYSREGLEKTAERLQRALTPPIQVERANTAKKVLRAAELFPAFRVHDYAKRLQAMYEKLVQSAKSFDHATPEQRKAILMEIDQAANFLFAIIGDANLLEKDLRRKEFKPLRLRRLLDNVITNAEGSFAGLEMKIRRRTWAPVVIYGLEEPLADTFGFIFRSLHNFARVCGHAQTTVDVSLTQDQHFAIIEIGYRSLVRRAEAKRLLSDDDEKIEFAQLIFEAHYGGMDVEKLPDSSGVHIDITLPRKRVA